MNEYILVAVLTETKVTSLTLRHSGQPPKDQVSGCHNKEYILGSRLKLGNFGANED